MDWISYLAIAASAILLGCTSAQAASANEVLPACKLYLSVVDRHGTVSQSELSHLVDAGECLGAVYAMLAVSHTLAEPLKFCPPVEFDAEQVCVWWSLTSRRDRSGLARTSRRLRWKRSGQSGRAGIG